MITVNELFSGIGAFRKALERLNIPHRIVGISEIDKYAIKSYETMYGETRNYGDISKVDKLDYADLWTYGFPCQDISLSGRQAGIVKGQTRSGLLFEVQRLLETAYAENELPKYLILENVKNLVGKKFKDSFESWLLFLEEIGYVNYWQVLNAKNYGIPQNRERVFVVSIRKDIDTDSFEFPKPIPLRKRLKDMLEVTVDDKYYLSDKMVNYLHITTEKNKARNNGNVYKACDIDGISKTITTKEGSRVKDNFIEVVGNYSPSHHDASRIVHPDGLAPTVKENHGTVTAVIEPHIIERSKCEWISEKGVKYICDPKRGMCTDINADVAQTLTATGQSNWTGSFVSPDIDHLEKSSTIGSNEPTKIHLKNGEIISSEDDLAPYRIRKLTPKECWRLMGFDDSDFEKANKVCSNTQLYKQAGNSIVVNVLEAILKNLNLTKSAFDAKNDEGLIKWLDELLGV